MLNTRSFAAGSIAALFVVTGLTLFTPSIALSAEASTGGQPIGKVISVKHSGYATRLQQSVKHTIKVGDTLYSGDMIDVKTGNVVQIALDSNKENIIHIPGDALVQITKDRAINLELSRGQVFALLDRLEPGTNFRVVTPTAVSTVRGTYFGVKTAGSGTETSVYKGAVGVNGRQPNGKALGTAIPISAGNKTSVAHLGTGPTAPKRMSQAEFDQINSVIGSLNGLKKPLNYSSLAAEQDRADAKKKGGAADVEINKSKKADLDEDASAGGKIVF